MRGLDRKIWTFFAIQFEMESLTGNVRKNSKAYIKGKLGFA